MKEAQFQKLFEPIRIGQMPLKNRIVMPPMGTGYAEGQGYVGQRLLDYYEARARGGAGLIIVEAVTPDMQCHVFNSQLSIGDDSYITGFRKLVEVIHQHGAKIAIQLQHNTMEIRAGECVQVSPSPIMAPSRLMGLSGKTPHELTTEEISEIIKWFTSGAKRAREAGFDGVEVHGAHQYLVASFLSSATNMRKDQYGSSVENRARILIEILQAIRETVGPDYPIWPRLNAQEYGVENGVTIEETKQVVPMAIDAGAQAVHVSAYGAGSYVMSAPLPDSPGFLVSLAEEVKKVTSVPVIAVGRLDPEIAEQTIKENKADLVAIGRRLITDPEWPNKVAEGRLDEINPCIGCMECLERPMFTGKGVACTVNATMGREMEYQIQPAVKVKRVIVAGGGPAGMEAARVAALRGHQVVLLEKASRLGGQLNVAALPPHKDDLIPQINFLVSQVEKAGVEIRLGTEVTPELIMEIKPDVVVIAVGSTPAIPEITGIARPNVVTAQDVLSGEPDVGQKVVIIGGGMVGCETGNFLAEKGKKTTIIEILERMADDMLPMVRRRLLNDLRRKQVSMMTSVISEEVTANSVTVTTAVGQKETIPADTVILAVGYQANNDLSKTLEGKVPEVYCIGDSRQVQRMAEAINDGYRTGLSI